MEYQGCLICGKEIIYPENTEELQCVYCGQEFLASSCCIDGHFVCDQCHEQPANDFIERACILSELTDPLLLAERLMQNPVIKMHGPEHHFLVPAVLLSAFYNKTGEPGQKPGKIQKARQRAEKILGGFCGTHGICGAAVGTGIFTSVITAATPLSGKEWQWTNRISARSLETIAKYGGPRCCKRDTFLAIIEAVKFINEQFDTALPVSGQYTCGFYGNNKACKQGECPFYKG